MACACLGAGVHYYSAGSVRGLNGNEPAPAKLAGAVLFSLAVSYLQNSFVGVSPSQVSPTNAVTAVTFVV